MNSTKYFCEHCNNTFALKYNFDKHISVCKFFKKSNQEKNDILDRVSDPLPSYREMFHLLKDLNSRVQKLEKENASLRRRVVIKKKDILTTLNSPNHRNPQTTLLKWIKESILPNVHKSLHIVFETNLLNGIFHLLETSVSSTEFEELPLKVFDDKVNHFYGFVETENWVLLTTLQINNQLNLIFRKFLNDFNHYWIQPNKLLIEKEESYKDKYVLYYKKILGDDSLTPNTHFKKIHTHLFELLKKRKEQSIEKV
jgi:hypothetical protein